MDHLHEPPDFHSRLQFGETDVGQEGKSRSATLDRVEHHLVLQVGSKDVLLFWAEGLVVATVLLEGNLLRTPEETELGVGQLLKDWVLETSVLLDTETGAEEHRLLGGIVWLCVKNGH